jgi:hypothetical protein
MSATDIGDVIHCHCTYKCNWNGYPAAMMGNSDKNRRFHPVILAVSTHEFCFMFDAWKNANPHLNPRFLMADASEA